MPDVGNQTNIYAEQNNTYTQMTNKQKVTIIENESFRNEYDRFIIDATDKVGNYIVEDALNEMTCQGVNTSILVDGETPEIAEVAYKNKRSCNFIYKIREDELRNASNTKQAHDELLSKINANLDEQDRKECWRRFPMIISETEQLKESQLKYNTDDTDYQGVLLAIRDDIRKLKTPTNSYNAYEKTVGSTTYTLKTFTNRPIVFILSSLLDEIEIKYQAGVINLDKIRVDADIVRVNTFYKLNPDFNQDEAESEDNVKYIEDDTKLWLTCGQNYVKIFRHFEKRASLEDIRNFSIGKAVTYIEYVSKLVPAIMHLTGDAPAVEVSTFSTKSKKAN